MRIVKAPLRRKASSRKKLRRLFHICFALSIAVVSFVLLCKTATIVTNQQSQTSFRSIPHPMNPKNFGNGKRILYIVTTLAEYDSGRRKTSRGFDRFQHSTVPVIAESVQSMMLYNYTVDLYLICHFTLSPERRLLLEQALPEGVGLQIWNDATPIGYKLEDKKHPNLIQDITRALARQHRFVIKDKFQFYDLFVCFEDDMLITGDAVDHFDNMTQELYRLKDTAPDNLASKENRHYLNPHAYYGQLSEPQLSRMLPGFIRVESILDEQTSGTREHVGPIPVIPSKIDPRPCCSISSPHVSKSRPSLPSSDSLFLWETDLVALGLRKMPVSSMLEWVMLQRGPRESRFNVAVPDYWSGEPGYYNATDRPDVKAFRYVNNQGGWMLTQRQLFDFHTTQCAGGFLPPFDSVEYNRDGLDLRNVEYWSGGLNLFSKEHGCNLQRIVSLDPIRFSKQLLYHTANNKQKQFFPSRREIMTRVNDFYGQLLTIQQHAEQDMEVKASMLAHQIEQAKRWKGAKKGETIEKAL